MNPLLTVQIPYPFKRFSVSGLFLGFLLFGFSDTGCAQVLSLTSQIVNPSFETPTATTNSPVFTVTGWGQGADTGEHLLGDIGAPSAGGNGTQLAFLGNGTTFTNLFQDLAVTNALIGTPSVTSFTLTIAFAVRTVDPTTNGTINLGIVDLTGTTAGPLTTAISRASLLTTTFQDFSVTLPATTVANGDTLRIFVDKLAGNSLIVIDNARLVANVVPEPGTVSLLALAGFGVLGLRRRRGAA